MTNYYLIRPYRDSRDIKQVLNLHKMTDWEWVGPMLVASLGTEMSAHLVVGLSAVLFIILGVPLHLCWISIPVVAFVVITVFLLGHIFSFKERFSDLENLEKTFLGDPKSGFWVLEEWRTGCNDSPQDKPVIVSKEDLGVILGSNTKLRGEIVGTLGVKVKHDKSLQEPPGTVGILSHLLILPRCRRSGLAQRFVANIWDNHCSQHFRAMELKIGEHKEPARKFFENQDWSIISVESTRHIFGLYKKDNWFLLRKPCVRGLL